MSGLSCEDNPADLLLTKLPVLKHKSNGTSRLTTVHLSRDWATVHIGRQALKSAQLMSAVAADSPETASIWVCCFTSLT